MSSNQSDLVQPRTALCSLSNMDQSEEFFKGLMYILPHLKLYATEGTANRLNTLLASEKKQHETRVTPINEYLSPHRKTLDVVKTLDMRIFSGILADRKNEMHKEAIAEQQLILFDIVIVNFYEEKIDIGGPAMLRAAAKNARYVTAISSPKQYRPLLVELRINRGAINYAFRRSCALAATHTAASYVHKCSRHIPRVLT